MIDGLIQWIHPKPSSRTDFVVLNNSSPLNVTNDMHLEDVVTESPIRNGEHHQEYTQLHPDQQHTDAQLQYAVLPSPLTSRVSWILSSTPAPLSGQTPKCCTSPERGAEGGDIDENKY